MATRNTRAIPEFRSWNKKIHSKQNLALSNIKDLVFDNPKLTLCHKYLFDSAIEGPLTRRMYHKLIR